MPDSFRIRLSRDSLASGNEVEIINEPPGMRVARCENRPLARKIKGLKTPAEVCTYGRLNKYRVDIVF